MAVTSGAISEFVEDRFPLDIAWGAVGGPEWFTVVATTSSGFEQRNVNWENARGRWNVAHELKTHAQLDALIAFFRACRGKAVGFRFRDWTDYSTDMPNTVGSNAQLADPDGLPPDGTMTPVQFGTASGVLTEYQLYKPYQLAVSGEIYLRPIRKPIDGALRVYVNDVLQVEGGGDDFTVDYTTGIISFNSPLVSSDAMTWDGLYDIPVRFDEDHMPISMSFFEASDWQGIEILELRLV